MAGAPCPREGVDKIDKLPSRPEKHTIYLLPDVGSRPRRPFPCLCYDPERAVERPDRYYTPRTLTHAQLMLAWRTYRLQKLRRLRWRSRLLEKAPSIYYFAFDEAERLLDFNTALGQAVRALVGRSPRRGQPFWDIVLPENQPSLREELRLLREGRALQLQRQIGPRRAEVCLMPLHKGVYGYYALDITVYHQLAELAMQQQSLQEEILGHLNEGLVVLDAQGKVLYVNPRAERFLGLSALEALGHPYPFSTQENLLVKGGRILETTSIPLPRAGQTIVVLRDISALWQAERFNRLYQAVVQEGPLGVFIWQGEVEEAQLIYANPLAQRWLPEQGRTLSETLLPYLPQETKRHFKQLLQARRPVELMLRAARKRLGWSHLACTLFPLHIEELGEKVPYWITILQDRTEVQRLLRRQAQLERQQSRLIVEAQEKERQRLAEELHDSVGVLLSVLKMELSVFFEELSLSPEQKERARQLITRIDEVTQTVRLVSHQLMPPLLEHFGLVPSLEGLVRQLTRISSLHITLRVEGKPVELPLLKVLHVYRIIQELLNNTLRHAKARSVSVVLRYQARALVIEVSDDGEGYAPAALRGGGIGLRNVVGRIRVLGGRWENFSAPGQGAHYRIEIPLTGKKS